MEIGDVIDLGVLNGIRVINFYSILGWFVKDFEFIYVVVLGVRKCDVFGLYMFVCL